MKKCSLFSSWRPAALLVLAVLAAHVAHAQEIAKPMVGVYYYPWFRQPAPGELGQWKRVMRLRLKTPQKPEVGLYDSRKPEVIGAHIAQNGHTRFRQEFTIEALGNLYRQHLCELLHRSSQDGSASLI